MKRIYVMLVMLLCLTACGNTSSEPASQPSEPNKNDATPVEIRNEPGSMYDPDAAIKATEPEDDPVTETDSNIPYAAGYEMNYTVGDYNWLTQYPPRFWIEYGDEMNDMRASFRLLCDGFRYMDTVFASDDWYADEIDEWYNLGGNEWDFAKVYGSVTWSDHPDDGYTVALLRLTNVDRQVIVSFPQHITFNTGDILSCYGIIALSKYKDGSGNTIDCMAMEVFDYTEDGKLNTFWTRQPSSYYPASVREMNPGPVDWSQIPASCYSEWIGPNRTFGTGNGYWYNVEEDTIAGWPYTVQYWEYDPYYNELYMGVTLDGREAAFEPIRSGELPLVWLCFSDAHLNVSTPECVNIALLREGYEWGTLEHSLLTEATNGFYGSAMFWPDGTKD